MSISALITFLLKHVGILIAGAFILLNISPVQELNFRRGSGYNKLFLVFFFGIFGVLGTYSGNAIFNSYANLRAMAVIPAGLFGGPIVGLGVGLIAGGHRFLIDPWGFSALPCAIATILEGLAAGFIHLRYPDRNMNWNLAMVLAFVGESMHMLLVLLLSRPYEQALELVKLIALPMIIGNALGAGLFIHVIKTLYTHREKKDSTQAQRIFDIANNTVRHLRSGLNSTTAEATARIIYRRLRVPAVAITDHSHVLVHVGLGNDHHLAGEPIVTSSTRKVIQTGTPIFLRKKDAIGCDRPQCPFHSAIIVPLKKGGRIVGTLKFYGSRTAELNRIQFEVARGLSDLLSIQLELEDIQVKDRLLAHAEIRHLQAQINPHFLFNSLNTIASFCRTAPDKARELILDLSLYMRKNLDSSRGFIRLADELAQINSYVAIETARFGDKIKVNLNIEPGCEDWAIPPLIIQPLVENAIKHGIAANENGGTISLGIFRNLDMLVVMVEDDGCGIPDNILATLLDHRDLESHAEGIGLRNSNKRLMHIYGPEYGMEITSSPQRGTSISFNIPKAASRGLTSEAELATDRA
ncbi:LytS/YhcK type 5TM receptor domain-containing protein [Desulforhopalus singaporensis]|uniref:histidine kinase n=1 Tax=Desulforhopalus singaporensis TaxID=91360 RepID=A0A1H0KUH2_9BACT|nr:LytS/YhcK type 5TM receptor domain-containing protein [Desulforhopalus singaporensis]SDO59390.1 two-component system, LytT family, sensor histidine kinase LytS [Desulforhopalus singaporensis]